MKQTPNKDVYINGWFNREFLHKPLWKSKMHFFYCFSEELYNINVPIEEQKQNKADLYLKKIREKRIDAICDIKCKDIVLNALHLDKDDIFQIPIEPKIRRINPNEIFVSLGDSIQKFSELAHDSFTVMGEPSKYCYWYVNLKKVPGENDTDKRKKIIDEIKRYIKNIF